MKHLREWFSFSLLGLILFFTSTLFSVGQSHKGYDYYHPRDESNYVSVYNNILIRYGEKISLSEDELEPLLIINGSKSGRIGVDVRISDDEKTLIYKPRNRFSPDEKVQVIFLGGVKTDDGNELPPMNFSFHTSKKELSIYDTTAVRMNYKDTLNLEMNRDDRFPSFQFGYHGKDSLPVDFPQFEFNTYPRTNNDYIFVSPFFLENGNAQHSYLVIADNYGTPIFYRKITGFGMDFKKQPNGLLTFFNAPKRKFYAINNQYQIVDSFKCGNGYPTDLHEIRILENGHTLLMSYDGQPIGMDTVVQYGNPNAMVFGLIIQELDLNKNVVFQWRSWDDFEITDCSHVNMTNPQIDYVHGNAIEVDKDGNFLISSRHLDEITKISSETGKVLWRMGGEKNEFNFVNDTRGFSRQHHIRVLENGNYTLFDNGNFLDPNYSSALEYKVDEENFEAELVWSYSDQETFGAFMGSVQRLENGNTFIGWGGTFPSFTEVNVDGEKLLEVSYVSPFISYRAFKFDWNSNALISPVDSLNFYSLSNSSDTIHLKIQNNLEEDLTITSAITHTDIFSLTNTLPFTIPAKSNYKIGIVGKAADSIVVNDILTLRADSETEGIGMQIKLNQYGVNEVNSDDIPLSYFISHNYPNPFNPSTTIEYYLPKRSFVEITIFNSLGQLVKNVLMKEMEAGRYSLKFNLENQSSGIYFYRITADSYSESKKMLFLK